MSLVRFRAANHPQQVRRRGPQPEVDNRATPPEVFEPLNRRFQFTLDVAASVQNAKCERFYTRENDGLARPWAAERVWCNPPYSDVGTWVRRASWLISHPPIAPKLVVMLVPANRTEQGWWQQSVEPYRDRGGLLRTEFLPGRLRFIRVGADGVGPNERPPFGCCLLIWEVP